MSEEVRLPENVPAQFNYTWILVGILTLVFAPTVIMLILSNLGR